MEKILEFIKHFFGYYPNESGTPEPYHSGGGLGAFSDPRHFICIIGIIVVAIAFYFIFKKHKELGKKVIFIMAICLFSTRVINQTIRAIIGAEIPWTRAFPFHLCTISSFLVPLCVIFNWKKLKPYAYTVGMMGGIITIIIGDYFDDSFVTFSTLEGITAHNLLILFPVFEAAVGNFSFKIKEIWKPVALTVIYLGWACLANEVFFKDYDTNYMYLKRNGLPGNLGGQYYFLIYIAIYLVLISIIYLIPLLINKRKQKSN